MANEVPHDKRVRLLSGINALLGVWLIISPWTVGTPSQSVGNSGIIVGVLIFMLSAVRFTERHTAIMSWGVVVLGAWTVMSPWVIGQRSGDFRTWNYVIVGVLMAAIETYSLTSSTTQAGWVQRRTGPR